jgi:hypothetical protein
MGSTANVCTPNQTKLHTFVPALTSQCIHMHTKAGVHTSGDLHTNGTRKLARPGPPHDPRHISRIAPYSSASVMDLVAFCNNSITTSRKFLPAAELDPAFRLLFQLNKTSSQHRDFVRIKDFAAERPPTVIRSRIRIGPCPSNSASRVRAMAPARPI